MTLRERAQQEAEREAAQQRRQRREDEESRERGFTKLVEDRTTRLVAGLKEHLGIEVAREDVRLVQHLTADGERPLLSVTVEGYEIVAWMNDSGASIALPCVHCGHRQLWPFNVLTDLLHVPDAYDCGCTTPLADLALAAVRDSQQYSEQRTREDEARRQSYYIQSFREQLWALLHRPLRDGENIAVTADGQIETVAGGVRLRFVNGGYGRDGIVAVLGTCADCGGGITTSALYSLTDLGHQLTAYRENPGAFHRCPRPEAEQPKAEAVYQPSPLAQLGNLIADALYEAGYELRREL